MSFVYDSKSHYQKAYTTSRNKHLYINRIEYDNYMKMIEEFIIKE